MFKALKPSFYSNFDFIKVSKTFFGVSLLLIIISIVSLFTKGLNFGIDFTGGLLFDITIPQKKDIAEVRNIFSSKGFDNFTIQSYGEDSFLIKLSEKESIEHIKSVINSSFDGEVKYNKVDYVGPQIGKELVLRGFLAMTFAILAIFIYIWIRFERRFGIGAVATFVHDLILIFGFYSIFNIEFDTTSIAAILTVLGYSVNNTVVVYDRIREFLVKYGKETFGTVINKSLHATLRRTLLTSSTTFLCLVALAFMGGSTIRNFSIVVMAGIVIGTYSSIFISAPILPHTLKCK